MKASKLCKMLEELAPDARSEDNLKAALAIHAKADEYYPIENQWQLIEALEQVLLAQSAAKDQLDAFHEGLATLGEMVTNPQHVDPDQMLIAASQCFSGCYMILNCYGLAVASKIE